MAINAAEEENIEALKQWWDENGKSIFLIFVLVFGGYGAWLMWQNAVASSAEAASDLYEELISVAVVSEPGAMLSDADGQQVLAMSQQLVTEHPDTVYARFASLFAAQQHVAADDLDAAEASLQWILDNPGGGLLASTDQGLQLTASLRLGRVILAKGDAERALSLVNGIDPQAFEPGFSELRGDIYAAMGRQVDAREAYLAAQQAGSNSDALRMKLENMPDES